MRMASGADSGQHHLAERSRRSHLDADGQGCRGVGNDVRAFVTYSGAQPEVTFNLNLFRWNLDSSGRPVMTNIETWSGLSMDPNSSSYAQDF